MLSVPKSKPLSLARMPFYLYECGDSVNITETVGEIRAICDDFTSRGLPVFPVGVPFTYWEQYFGLRRTLGIGLLAVLGGLFLILTILLLNPVIAFIVVSLYLAYESHRDFNMFYWILFNIAISIMAEYTVYGNLTVDKTFVLPWK